MNGRRGLKLAIRAALIGAAALVMIVAGLIFLVPVDSFRGPIEQAAKSATGRTLSLRGPIGLTLYPEIGLSIADVSFANAPGAREPEMASVGRLVVGVRLWPLLSRRVEVTRLILEKPVVHLEVARDGTGNWVFGAQAPQTPAEPGGPSASFSLSNLRLEDGSFSYFDARSGMGHELQQVNVAVAATSLDMPFEVTGGATYKGHRLELNGNLGNLGAALNQTETPATLSLASDVVKLSLDGAVGGSSTASGKLHLEMASLRQFANWLEVSLPPGKGLGKFSLDSTVTVAPQSFAASGIKFALDDMNMTGDFRLRSGGARPAISGKLLIDRLDLNTYMTEQPAGAAPAAPAAAAPSEGWSTTPLDFALLKAIDAELELQIERLLVRNLEVQKSQIAVGLKAGVLDANLKNISMYGGAGKAALLLDASRARPTLKNSLDVRGLQVGAFLTAFLGVDRIEGTGNVGFDVTSEGASPNAIIASLAGKGEIDFRNGMIKGVDLASVARTVQSALLGDSVGGRAQTDFAELGATFTIAKGVMTNKDFHLLNPFVRMTGNGTVDLANRSLDIHMEPKLVASTQGQGAGNLLSGVGIPFRASGPWTKLSYGPDLKNVGKALTNTILDTLTGKGNAGQPGAQRQQGVGNVLQGLFGR